MIAMSRQTDWKRVLLICTLHLCSYTAATVVHVHLEAPRFVKFRDTATLVCNHSVAESDLHKIEFIRNGNKIFQFIKDRNPPIIEHRVPGAEVELTTKMNMIKLNDVRFEVSGEFSCDISTLTPIYTKGSNSVVMQVIGYKLRIVRCTSNREQSASSHVLKPPKLFDVIPFVKYNPRTKSTKQARRKKIIAGVYKVPQSEDPLITFKKSLYDVGDILEANCTSSPAHPAPHLTWFINGKEVDITLITTYPKRPHGNQLASTVAQLRIKVSALHAGDNGKLEISCHSTIPTYPVHHRQYADFRSKTALVDIVRVPIPTSSVSNDRQSIPLLIIGMIIVSTRQFYYSQEIIVWTSGWNVAS